MISVIIPVYNVEKYLSQCLESVIRQTYQDLEIIVIDDGSTDESPRICDEYAEKDTRIRVIHKQNAGAASARNAGLKIATGEYLAFVDSDDYLNTNAYETMLGIMQRTTADIVECAFCNEFPNRTWNRIFFEKETLFSTVEYLKLYTDHWICSLIWEKLYKRSLFEGIEFEEGHQIDDEFFTYQGVMNAKTIVYNPTILYHYRMRSSGVMRDKTVAEKKLFDRLEYSTIRREKVTSRFPELKQVYDESYLNFLVVWSENRGATKSIIQEIQRLIKDYFKTNKPCKMKLGFRLQLLKLQHAAPEKLLAKRPSQAPKKDENQYYE